MGRVFQTIVVLAMSTAAYPVMGERPHIQLTQNQKFAACVVHEDRVGSDALVRSEPATDAEDRFFSVLAKAIERCDGQTGDDGLFPRRAMFRGMLAERLWLDGVWAFGGSANTPVDPNKIDFDKGFDSAPALRDNYRLSFCLAYTRPELIDQLLRTNEQSPEEAKFFEALSTDISHCLPVGRSVSLDRRWLRASLAEQLYRRYPPAPRFQSRSAALLKGK